VNEPENREQAQALFDRLWTMGYELIGPGPHYAIHNHAHENHGPKPPMGDTRHMTLAEVGAWIEAPS
jgi:hypothetical protein